MPSPSTEAYTASTPSWTVSREPLSPVVRSHVRALVVSPRLEVRQPLIRTLESLAMDVTACATCHDAEEVLATRSIDLVFCDDRLPEGSYADLIRAVGPRVIVVTRTGDWDLYLEALSKGAFDVIRCPWHPTDVELTVIRALRESGPLAASVAA